MKLVKNKKNKKAEKVVEIKQEKTEDVVVKTETPVVETKAVRSTRSTKKREPKVPCRIILAKPSYYVIEKNGEKITINKKNSYKRGEEVLY